MQEHFIPQDISNYRFHLIGELDLQQFLEIMAGVVLGFIIYKIGLPGIITWPLVLIAVGLGLVAAFVPIADQPLSHWLKVFFHLLSAPTKFYWRKEVVVPAYFTYELQSEHQGALSNQETFNATPVKKHRALDYFTSLDQQNRQDYDHLEIFSPNNIQAAMNQFNLNSSQHSPLSVPATPRKKVLRRPSIQEGQSLRIRPIIAPSQKNIDSFINSAMSKPTKLVTKIASLDEKTLGWPHAKLAHQQKTSTPAGLVFSGAPQSLPAQLIIKSPTSSSITLPPSSASSAVSPSSPTITKASSINEGSFFLKGKIVDSQNQPISGGILSVKDAYDNFKFLLHSDESGNFISAQPLKHVDYHLLAQIDALIFPIRTINFTTQGAEPVLLKAN